MREREEERGKGCKDGREGGREGGRRERGCEYIYIGVDVPNPSPWRQT